MLLFYGVFLHANDIFEVLFCVLIVWFDREESAEDAFGFFELTLLFAYNTEIEAGTSKIWSFLEDLFDVDSGLFEALWVFVCVPVDCPPQIELV